MFEVEDVFAGREQFPVGMERSGCCCALLWGEGLTNTEPREGKPDGDKSGAESVGGVGGGLGDGRVGWVVERGDWFWLAVGSVLIAIGIYVNCSCS
jgi:hypothetical protein